MNPETLGKNNNLLKQIRRAISQDSLTSESLLVIEGEVLIAEAVKSGVKIVKVLISDDRTYDPPQGVPAIRLTPDLFQTIKSTDTAKGIIALVRPPLFNLEEVISKRPEVTIVMCRVQDPGNAGTILRTAEAFGATCVATSGTVSIYNSKLVRASAGSIFRVPHCWNTDLEKLVPSLQDSGVLLLGAQTSAGFDITNYSWKQPVAILIGNEGEGLNEREKAVCSDFLRIRHNEKVQSLNAAIATGIVLYEASRRKFMQT